MLAALCLLLPAAPALAGTATDERPFLFGIDGSGSSIGPFTALLATASDDASGDIYVINAAGEGKGPTGYGTGPKEWDDERVVCRFDAEGNPKDFTAGSSAGKSCLDGKDIAAPPNNAFGVEGFFESGASRADVAVDNSGGAAGPGEGEQGRLYLSEFFGPIHAFDPEGAWIRTIPISVARPCGIAVGPEGDLFVGNGNASGEERDKVLVFDPDGNLTEEIAITRGIRPCRLALDRSGTVLYVALISGGVDKYAKAEVEPGVFEWAYDSTVTTSLPFDIAIDQLHEDGHLFADDILGNAVKFHEFLPCAEPGCPAGHAQAQGSPFGRDLIGLARGIAHDPDEDRVYVSDKAAGTLKAFGPATSGPVPDVSCQATDELARFTATAHCTINPGGLENEYRFEWAKGGDEVQHLTVSATEGSFRLISGGPGAETTNPLPFNVSASPSQCPEPECPNLEEELEALGEIGPGNVEVSGTPVVLSGDPENPKLGAPGEYEIAFTGDLSGTDVPQLVGLSIDLKCNGCEPGANVSTTAPGPVWGTARSSPSQSAPADNADHQVSFGLTDLEANTPYSVRLVGANAEEGMNLLAAYSKPDVFATIGADDPPGVSIKSITEITAESAHASATIEPQGDKTTWRVLSASAGSGATGEDCEGLPDSAFATIEEGTISVAEAEEAESVQIEADLEGLLAAQTHCLRAAATNSAGTGRDDERFQTLAIPPTQADTAFAAPRTDTTARINAWVNPEGQADLTYRFEVSEDEGETWTERPLRESSPDAREQVLIAEELDGLQPSTTYRYRLGALESHGPEGSGGPAASLGTERAFTTRSAAEVTLPERGIELVNNPDKGNQNVLGGSNMPVRGISPNGERAIWRVAGGAPGSTNPVSTFLAERTGPGPCPPGSATERTDSGWCSRSLPPEAERQVGGGSVAYNLRAANPGLSRFVFDAVEDLVFGEATEATRLRLDDAQNQDVLRELTWTGEFERAARMATELSDDGAHVVILNAGNDQLEEIGTGPPEVLSIMPDGTQSECGLLNGPSFVGGGTGGGGSLAGAALQYRPGYHMIATTDASLVYFEAKPNGECGAPWGLYVRDREAGQTTPIDPGTGEDVAFITAGPDGRSGWFTTYSQLSPADANEGADIYRWDQEAKEASCLSCDAAPGAVERNSGEYGRVLVSGDFSRFYFEAAAELVAGRPLAGGARAQNVYVLREDGSLGFVAKGTASNEVQGLLFPSDSKLSADGRALALRAAARPYLSADRVAAGAGPQLFLYEDGEGSLECLTCVRDGVTSEFGGTTFELSEDGSTLAFTTANALGTEDVNRGADVYEWRGGERRPLSSGVAEYPSAEFAQPKVQGIDATGSNILFSVTEPGLTGFEQDGLANLYDARIGGGFAPPSPPAHCTEDSCQGPLRPPPAQQRTASEDESRGNVAPRGCGGAARRARSARRRARHAADPRRAKRLAKRAKRLAKRARRCRAAQRRAAR